MNKDLHDELTQLGFEPSTGCWIDSNWGQWGITRLISIAQDYGLEITDNDEAAVNHYKDWKQTFLDPDTGEEHDTLEWVLAVADDAEDWLNVQIARPGYSFGWVDGELFYMNDEWWEDELGDEFHLSYNEE